MDCDLCGRAGDLYKTVIEDSQMNVCGGCSKYGHVTGKIGPIVKEKRDQKQVKAEELVELIVGNFGDILKKKREQLGLNQKEFARKIAEKESSLHKMETGSLMPTLDKARKLEKSLKIKLIEEISDAPVTKKKPASVMTLGDLVKIKWKKFRRKK